MIAEVRAGLEPPRRDLGFAGAQSRVGFLGVRGRIDGGPGAAGRPFTCA